METTPSLAIEHKPFTILPPEEEAEREALFAEVVKDKTRWEPVKLKPVHKLILRLYGQGMSVRDIITHPNLLEHNHKYTKEQVYAIIRSKPAQIYLSELDSMLDDEFLRLKVKYVDAMRDALESKDPKERIAACSLFQKRVGEKLEIKLTAEDEIKQLMGGK